MTLHVGDQAGSGAQALLTAAGLIGKLPFKADWSDFTSGPPMLQAMGAGAIDIGAVGDAPPVFAAAGGEQDRGGRGDAARPRRRRAARAEGLARCTRSPQLKGKTIAVAEGSSANYHLLAVLKQAGLTVKDVTIDNLQPAAGPGRVRVGAGRRLGHLEPRTSSRPRPSTAPGSWSTAPRSARPYSFEVASRAALADPAKAAAIRAYLQLIAQAHAWANTHPAAVGRDLVAGPPGCRQPS